MKIVSYNVNGIRAAIKKGLLTSIEEMGADIICLQETKAQDEQILEALGEGFGYHIASNSAIKKGYSGTCIISKASPLSMQKGIGMEAHDQEGRVLTAEFANFYVINVYVPNVSRDFKRLAYRQSWDADFKSYIKNLEITKPVVVCGDMNVAHQPIDLARPKANYNKTAGYTQVEIDGMTNLIGAGLTDSYRYLHPEEVAYSWWSYRAGARAKNIGWRLDYFLVSASLLEKVKFAEIHPQYKESDHCPVSLVMAF